MYSREIVYDITRLATRFSRPVPNGIDRVDIGYASHFLSRARGGRGALMGVNGLRAVDNAAAGGIVDTIAAHWREDGRAENDVEYARLLGRLGRQPSAEPGAAAPRPAASSIRRSLLRLLGGGNVVGAAGLFPARDLSRTAPPNAIYLNTSQFPLWIDGYFRWLDRRPDVKAVFFIHDLLPISHPEFFPQAEAHRHASRLEVAARRAAALVVASEHTKSQLVEHIRKTGLTPPPIAVVPLPVTYQFLTANRAYQEPVHDTRNRSCRYFVTVGTIEPRKNHLLLLNIWRDLHQRLGSDAPLLVLAGIRGWDNENVIDMIERCPALKDIVFEVHGLSTPGLRQILAGATALLMPTLAEGYGLPVVEACASGVPVIASDIEVFRHLDGHGMQLVDPLDGPGWIAAIMRHLDACVLNTRSAMPNERSTHATWAWHLDHVEQFLNTL